MGSIIELHQRRQSQRFQPLSGMGDFLRKKGIFRPPTIAQIERPLREQEVRNLKGRFRDIVDQIPENKMGTMSIRKPSFDELGRDWLHFLRLADILEGNIGKADGMIWFIVVDDQHTASFELLEDDTLNFREHIPEEVAVFRKVPQDKLERERSRIQFAIMLLSHARITGTVDDSESPPSSA